MIHKTQTSEGILNEDFHLFGVVGQSDHFIEKKCDAIAWCKTCLVGTAWSYRWIKKPKIPPGPHQWHAIFHDMPFPTRIGPNPRLQTQTTRAQFLQNLRGVKTCQMMIKSISKFTVVSSFKKKGCELREHFKKKTAMHCNYNTNKFFKKWDDRTKTSSINLYSKEKHKKTSILFHKIKLLAL